MDDPEFEIHETNVLVVRNAGPKGYPGMPEVANLPVPKKILNKGILFSPSPLISIICRNNGHGQGD